MITAAEALMLSGCEDQFDRVQSILNSVERAIRNRSMFERARDLSIYEMLTAEQADAIRKALVESKFGVTIEVADVSEEWSDGLAEYAIDITW